MNDTTVLHAAILGAFQGFTEFLPISSSAHLIVLSWMMDGRPLPLALNIALHMGTFLAVVLYFWRDWLNIGGKTLRRVTKNEKSFEADVLLPGLVLGSLPAGIIGLLWHKQIESVFHHPYTVVGPMVVMGIVLWLVDKRCASRKDLGQMTRLDAFLIGCGQALALVPGVSRSGSTITTARLLGVRREDAARFSFLLSTPVMAGAVVLEGKELLASAGDPVFIVGFLTSFVVGCLSIGGLLKFLKRFGFEAFAIYRVAFAIAVFFLVLQ